MDCVHVSQSGDGLDTLYEIALYYGVSYAELMSLNPDIMSPSDTQRAPGSVRPGDRIILPTSRFGTIPVGSTVAQCPGLVKIEIVTDDDKDYVADNSANTSVADYVRFGLWDQAYDGAGDVKNGVAEADNFVGSDTRRFYFRVHDPDATGPIEITWRTLLGDRSTDDDTPASMALTLLETSPGSQVFTSKAVMLVTDDIDRAQETDSGLPAGDPTAGSRAQGQKDHRLRRAAIDGFVKGEYVSPTGEQCWIQLPIFRRVPDDRRRLMLQVIRYTDTSSTTYVQATDAYIDEQVWRANQRWNQVGLQVDAEATVDRAIPAGALDATGLYAGGADNSFEQAALGDLIPISPDGTLTVVFVNMTGNNAYATVATRSTVTLGDRFFVFVNTTLSLEDLTLAHELHHVLFNRFDDTVDRQYMSFNTNAPSGYGVTLPDVRVYRRIQNAHNGNDPDNDPNDDNVINWFRRARSARSPALQGPTPAADSTTGNTLVTDY